MDLDRIERERRKLELQIAKLEQSLRTWQLWEAEYEGLREEIDALPSDASEDQLLTISTSFGGDVVTETIICELLGANRPYRSPRQISALLSRRLDYTQQNVNAITKQLDAAHAELEPTGSVRENGLTNEQGEAMSEIIEELDDEDKVISSRICNPNDSTNDLVETLKKSGVSETESTGETGPPGAPESVATAALPAGHDSHAETAPRRQSQQKSVSFAEGTKLADNASANSPRSVLQPAISQLAKGSFGADEKVWELDENDRPVDFTSPHIPANESPEDAALRRQMLQYNMSELGAVVAELNLEEAGSSDDMYEEDDNEDDDSDMEEDEHGISKYSAISDDYRDEMRRLEEKLNAQVLQNVGPAGHLPEANQTIANHPNTSTSGSTGSAEPVTSEKSVRFASQPDVAPAQDAGVSHNTKAAVNDVTERAGSNAGGGAEQQAPKKVSRFKAERSAAGAAKGASQLAQRKDTPMAETVVERPVRNDANGAAPPDADELHPEQLRRDVAQDYYRQRNNLIRRQGGFLQDDDLDDAMEEVGEGPPMEAPKNVSRFKAARVQPDKIW